MVPFQGHKIFMGVSKGVAQPLAQRVLSFVESSKYQPLNKTELAKKLGVPVDERAALRKLLVQLESSGKVTGSGRIVMSFLRPRT